MPSRERKVEALYAVMHAARALMHRLKVAAAELHGQGELSAGKRGVLLSLDALGPRTVPQLARDRPVSRQHIQMLVNPLLEDGCVELVDNPAHKRSKLVQLTEKGMAVVAAMKQREAAVFDRLPLALAADELARTASTLDTLKQLFESDAWRQAVAETKRRR